MSVTEALVIVALGLLAAVVAVVGVAVKYADSLEKYRTNNNEQDKDQ